MNNEMMETGTILQNRYRIEKQIGQGGMGAVYVATDERFGSRVAIKETLFADENFRRAFEREARLLNSLRHPALPNVSDHFTDGNGQFLVMEFIAGEDLAEMMARNGKPFPPEDVLKWANQLLEALDFLHNQQIPVIHRDIKPQNLKLSKRGQIILLDFGLAKGNPTDAAHQTAAKSIFGYSPGYASLEQIQGTGTEPRSDLYSLAATLYHLLSGVPPTDALTRAMTVLNELDDPLKPVNKINPLIPAGVANVLHRAMALNANHRPESAAVMREMLANSDKYVESDAAKTASAAPLATSLYDQETKIIGERKNPKQSEVKTEIMRGANSSPDLSRETKLVSLGAFNTKSENPGTKYKIAAALFGGLILIGTAFSAFYISDTRTTDRDNDKDYNVEYKTATQTSQSLSNKSANAETSETETADVNSVETDDESQPNEEPASETASKSKTSEKSVSKKNEKGSTGAKTKDKKPNEATTDGDAEKVTVGNAKVRGDRVETDEYIIEDNRVIFRKKPGSNTVYRPALSPEQIEKLRKLRQMRPKVKTPKPPPTPPEHP